MKRQLFTLAEIGLPIDFERMTLFPQEATDAITSDAIGYPAHWANFTIAVRSAQEVRVSAGRYYAGGIVYASDVPIDINLQPHLPLVASDERWVALILRGATETVNEDRFLETSQDAETSEPVLRSLPKIEARQISFVVQQGPISPAPALRPIVAENDACIAFVKLSTAGVGVIEPGEKWRVKSLFEVEGRVTTLEGNLENLFLRTSTLESDLTNTNAAVAELRAAMLRPEIARQMRRDIAALRRDGRVPDGARSDWYDPGLLPDQWHLNHPLARFRVNEGVHHPFAAELEARLNVVAEDDPRLRFSGRRMMPAWTEVTKIQNWGTANASRDISQAVHTEINAIRREVSRSEIRYGPTQHVCENQAEWNRYLPFIYAGQTFTKNNETFVVDGYVAEASFGPHQVYAVKTVQKVEWTETYWDYVTEKIGVAGSVFGQTMLVAQPMVITSIDLDFGRVGQDGDIHLFVCETDSTGSPEVSRVLANVTASHSSLRLGANRISLPPTFLDPGKRYAWFAVTVGNHQLRGTNGNAYSGGTSFRITDGVWAQGDLDFDFRFRLNGARFTNTRTVVNFAPLTLQNGMSEIRLLFANWRPEGTALEWEIRASGQEHWYRLEATEDNPLLSLPSLVELRLTILATQDLAPMVLLDASAVSRAARAAPDMRAISKTIDLGLTTTTIQTLTVLDDFDPALHTFSPRITVGDASQDLIAPSTNTVTIDPDRPEHREVLSTYTVPAGSRYVRNAPGLSTTNPVDTSFIENTALFAL